MARKEVINNELNDWLITFLKTVDMSHVVYYRLTNMQTYKTIEVAAHRLVDEIINNKRNIQNIRSQNNKFIVLTQDGYGGTEDIIVVDEFDSDIQNIYEWALTHGDLGCKLIDMYDKNVNISAPSNISIDSAEKLAWSCPKGHRIYMDFATMVSTKCECPICKAKESGKAISLKAWAYLTNNMELLEQYRSCNLNTKASSEIAYDSTKQVYWRKDNEDVLLGLRKVTVGGERPFKDITPPINLSR